MELAEASPSGNREASAGDEVLVFDMTLPSKNTLETGSMFEVYFKTAKGLDPMGDETVVNLVVDGTVVGTGSFSLVDPSVPSEGTALITTTKEVKFKGGDAKVFSVSTDTAAIMADEAKADEALTVGVEYNGKSVTGNTLTY